MSISRYNLVHAYLFYIRCSFFLEKGNNSRNADLLNICVKFWGRITENDKI